jgi:hypothetical protein
MKSCLRIYKHRHIDSYVQRIRTHQFEGSNTTPDWPLHHHYDIHISEGRFCCVESLVLIVWAS